jgi:hypothetical protein
VTRWRPAMPAGGRESSGNPQPTAWNAVTRAAPIELGGC